ncbi:hypothetical protein E5676_scaffold757G00360 [Cucumis melo var. makuwa]|uniref:Uncharacterized protein n=1 Tax=Cucumis melo var. makuwa TaxID=1194695 RepID=A0A5A7VGG5_CUCMM|nr:hypothetical protein E6C27_scaffold40G001180 [Cucumis melo var. makuwa]TYK09553.1 hypothetical protein E5676_scaffold757G00360 [Cucumis melo var. makuwa]
MSERVENVAVRNKAVEYQEVGHLKLIVEEFMKRLDNISLLEPGLLSDEPGLKEAIQQKKLKAKAGISKPKDFHKARQ